MGTSLLIAQFYFTQFRKYDSPACRYSVVTRTNIADYSQAAFLLSTWTHADSELRITLVCLLFYCDTKFRITLWANMCLFLVSPLQYRLAYVTDFLCIQCTFCLGKFASFSTIVCLFQFFFTGYTSVSCLITSKGLRNIACHRCHKSLNRILSISLGTTTIEH